MIESWRWYGPDLDTISLNDISQTGAHGIVTALHEIPYGEVWPVETIATRRQMIEAGGLEWVVVESLPIHEAIKQGQGDLAPIFANYRQSMANLASEGVTTICYNFMPVLDWTRTHLTHPNGQGGTCLRFSAPHMAAFELYMLGREEAAEEYSPQALETGKTWFDRASDADQTALLSAIMAGIPGAFDRYDIPGLKTMLAKYSGVGHGELRNNLKRFLEEVVPAAEDLGVRLCIHPDDPPRSLLGLPRIVSNEADIDWMLNAVDSPANGLTLCSGSLGANPANDVPSIALKFASRIHFAHLRNVSNDPDGSFQEAAHLEGDTDMVALASALLEGAPHIAWRPDHGHEILTDLDREYVPGYPLVGRLRGLAELRGVFAALTARP